MKIGIIGGSGYTGGELLRLLLLHPNVEVTAVVSRTHAGSYVFKSHPNLRKQTMLKFMPLDLSKLKKNCDLVFTATPHGATLNLVSNLLETGIKVIDMSADFRLKTASDYEKWYGWKHSKPELLKDSVYGLPELHREQIRSSHLIACPGCMATAAILALAPIVSRDFIHKDKIVVDVKVGSSGSGSTPTLASHHPERFGGVRAYNVYDHRHIAEIEQELKSFSDDPIIVSFTPHSVNMVRGILATIHLFLKQDLQIPEIWRLYRGFYRDEPFIRIIRENQGIYRLPNSNLVICSNFCDISFELDSRTKRMILFSAIDNLIKGAAGQAIQCLNILLGIDQRTGLEAQGFHPM